MTIKFSEKDMTTIATKVTNMLLLKLQESNNKPLSEMVGVNEAAEILGITPGRMREIKDRFPHIKAGSHQQGRLLFYRKDLLSNY